MIHRYLCPLEHGRRLSLSKGHYLEDLEDYRCPECGNYESFVFDANGSVEVFKDGRHEYRFGGADFISMNAFAKCPKCHYRGRWKSFNRDIQNVEEAPVLKFLLSWWHQYEDSKVSVNSLRNLAHKFRISWRDCEECEKDELPASIMHSSLVLNGNIILKPVFVDEEDGVNYYRLVGKAEESL